MQLPRSRFPAAVRVRSDWLSGRAQGPDSRSFEHPGGVWTFLLRKNFFRQLSPCQGPVTSEPRTTISKPTSNKEWAIGSSLRAAGLVV